MNLGNMIFKYFLSQVGLSRLILWPLILILGVKSSYVCMCSKRITHDFTLDNSGRGSTQRGGCLALAMSI